MKAILNRLSSVSLDEKLPDYINERLYNATLCSWGFGIVLISYIVIFSTLGIFDIVKDGIPFMALFWLIPIIGKKGYHRLFRILLLINLNVVVFMFSASLGRNSGVHFWFIAATQTAFYIFDIEELFLILVTAFFSIFLFLFLWSTDFQSDIFSHKDLPLHVQKVMYVSMLLGSVFTTFTITYRITFSYRKAKVFADISLQTLTENLRALDASSIVGITDPQGVLVHVNDEFCRISGYSREELIGKTHAMIKSDYHSLEFYRELWGTIKSGNIWQGEVCNRTKQGKQYWVFTTITPVMDRNNKIKRFVSIRFDITQNKLLQQQIIETKEARETELVRELKASQAKLIQSAKLASLGIMSSGLAHEINNPLMFIKGFNNRIRSALRRHGQVSENEIGELVKEIDDGVERLAKIVQNMREFSQDRKGERQNIKVNELINKSFALFHEHLKQKGIRTELALDPIGPLVRGNTGQLEQVLFNLISNSRDAMENKTDVEKKIQVISRQSGGKVEIVLSDNGSGIKESDLAHIFDPFYTTKEVGKGTGLGLSISHGIITEHGGMIQVSTSPGQGTTFTIQLPSIEEERA